MDGYWSRIGRGRHTRRRFLTTAGATGVGATALGLVGCGDDDDSGNGGSAGEGGESPQAGATRTPQPTATPVPSTPSGGKVTMVVPAPDLLDPQRLFQVPIRSIIYALYDGLVSFDETLSVVSELAEDWEVVDGKDYVMKLRSGVKFHDGTDFNAEAVVVNFERLLDPATQAPDAAVFPGLQVAAIDDHTVRFTNQAPNADFLLSLAEKPGQMISPKAIADLGNDVGTSPVGAGPFRFVRWVQGDHIAIERNPDYWDGGYPFLDEIEFRDIQDASIVSAGLRSGDLDIGEPAAADFDSIANSPDFQVWSVPGIGHVSDIILFPKNEPFGDPKTRNAVVWALDRATINDVVYAGLHIEPHGYIPPSFWAYDPQIDQKGFRYDPQEARAFMSAAGLEDGFEFTNWIANSPGSVRLAEVMQLMLQDVGIKMNIEAVESNARIDLQRTGEIQATNAGFSGRVSLDQFFTINFHTNGGFNYASYSVPERDALIEQARQTFDQEERTQLYRQLEMMLVEDPGPRVPHVFRKNQYVVRQGIGQSQPAYLPDNMIRFKYVFREA